MDNQNQNSNIPPSQNPQPVDLPANYKSPYLNHEKILQPSQAFVDEMQLNNNNKAEITNSQPATTPVAPATAEPLYPEVTHGSDSADQQTPVFNDEQLINKKTKNSKRAQVIVVLVILFGVYIAVTALLGLIGAVRLLTFGALGASSGDLITIVDIIYLILGAGIIFRRELARMAYVIISVIGLVLSLTGGVQYFGSISSVGLSYLLLPIIEAYAISVIPLILITRPSVKAVFS